MERAPQRHTDLVTRTLESDLFRDHIDRATGTFFSTDTATLAVVILELILARLDLGDRIVRAHAEAVVTSEAVTT